MITATAAAGVAAVSLAMALSPGPNMIYLVSRTLSQGRRAGLLSLSGVALGFIAHLVCASLGLAAFFAAVPSAFMAVKIAGALYLAWLAWGMLRPGGASPFEPGTCRPHSPRRLVAMGLMTNLLNPKIALMYVALIPQFLQTDGEPVWRQFLMLGAVQVAIGVLINGAIVLAAARVSAVLAAHPKVGRAQRIASGGVLGYFAVRMVATK